jgi:D-alanyl-D-alanine carboxypeptidase (penicillin-binding protein 5/6)
MVKRIVAGVIATLLLLSGAYVSYTTAVNQMKNCVSQGAFAMSLTSARGMCTMEQSTRRVLFEQNGEARLPMASTTKIVTAITVIEALGENLDTPFEIDPRAIGIEGTSIYLQKGEKLTARELLYGLMLRSGNDAATALALRVSKTVDEFAALMNQTAARAGANNSSFKNPHGLDQEGHYTTARDLALITAYAMENAAFCQIVSTKETKISGKDYPRLLRNKNRLLHSFDDCVGVKTGFTKKAGRCYVGATESSGMTVICVVLNCGPMFEDAARLMETADQKFTMSAIISKEQFIPFTDGETRGVALGDLFYPIATDDDVKIAPTADGEVTVCINGQEIYRGKYNRVA